MMPQFMVKIRGTIPIEGRLEGLEHLSQFLKHSAGTGIEAVSSQEAAALAIRQLPPFSDVQLIYVVQDDLDGIEVFLPTAEPVTFERHKVSNPVQRQCLLLLTEHCLRRGVPRGQALFTSEEAKSQGGQWICEACAALVETDGLRTSVSRSP